VPADALMYMPGIGVNMQYYNRASVSPASLERLRHELELSSEDLLFTMVAEFNRGKRHADALRALARVGNPACHLALAGTGPLLPAMQQLAENLGIRRQVHFLGFREDIPRLLCASTATLLPSEREGLPRCIMESYCCGVPVIGTNIRGIRELITESSGFKVPVGNVEQLGKAMRWMCEHPQIARVMGERGRERMHSYDFQLVVGFHEELYARAMKEELTGDMVLAPAA